MKTVLLLFLCARFIWKCGGNLFFQETCKRNTFFLLLFFTLTRNTMLVFMVRPSDDRPLSINRGIVIYLCTYGVWLTCHHCFGCIYIYIYVIYNIHKSEMNTTSYSVQHVLSYTIIFMRNLFLITVTFRPCNRAFSSWEVFTAKTTVTSRLCSIHDIMLILTSKRKFLQLSFACC